MGTRNLTVVVLDGEVKVAQYGQWDGYPAGQGATALTFLKNANIDVFKEKVSKTQWATEQDVLNACKAITGNDSYSMTYEQGKEMAAKYPEFSRDTAAEILPLIYKREDVVLLENAIDFAGDSLFCEWAYVIDLDKETFEAYSGFNKEPLDESERFFSFKSEHKDYYPVKLVKSYKLSELPEEDVFIKDCDPEEED